MLGPIGKEMRWIPKRPMSLCSSASLFRPISNLQKEVCSLFQFYTCIYKPNIYFFKKRIGLSYRTSIMDISLTDKVRLSKSPDHLNFHSHLLLILNSCSCSKTKYQHEGNSLKFQSLKPISFKSSGIIPIFFSVS